MPNSETEARPEARIPQIKEIRMKGKGVAITKAKIQSMITGAIFEKTLPGEHLGPGRLLGPRDPCGAPSPFRQSQNSARQEMPD